MATEKPLTPAYGSYRSFNTFFAARREDGHITNVVDRSLMSNWSGSTANELLACLKFLKMINDKGAPTPLYEDYFSAPDEPSRKTILAKALVESYPFLWNTPGFDLERGTSAQMADVFRSQGINGSTLSRAIGFFLAAAKDAGIKVSGNIKAPAIVKSTTARPPKEAAPAAVPAGSHHASSAENDPGDGVRRFEIPIPGKDSVKITVPSDFDADDFDMLDTVLKAYIKRWKGFVPKQRDANKEAPNDNGPAE